MGGGGGTASAAPATGQASTSPYAATTDAEGKYRFEKVEPGSYMLSASRQGFVQQSYGSRQPMMGGAPLKLAGGQELKQIDMKLTPHAVVIGRVVDEEGEPLARVQIQVLRRSYMQGKEQMLPVGGGMTADNGEFRVAELPPGRYWISATNRSQAMLAAQVGPVRNAEDKPEEEYVTTYHPSTADLSSASRLELAAGQELQGIDIRMLKARAYRIRGKVIGSIPQGRAVRVMLVPRDRMAFMSFMGNSAGVKEDGGFELAGAHPGLYHVTAVLVDGPVTILGKTAVEITRNNVDGVSVTAASPMTISGSIRVDGDVKALEQAQGRKLSFAGIRVQLSPFEGIGMGMGSAQANAEGVFSVEKAGADKYRVNVFNLPKGTWLKSVRSGDQEVLETGLDLSAAGGSAAAALEVTLSAGTGQIDGAVQDAKQQPAAACLVTFVPEPFKSDRVDLFRTATTDLTGRFTLDGIAPGVYKVYAWGDDYEPGSQMDPEFLKKHESKGQKVTVKENSREQVSLTQILVDPAAPSGK